MKKIAVENFNKVILSDIKDNLEKYNAMLLRGLTY